MRARRRTSAPASRTARPHLEPRRDRRRGAARRGLRHVLRRQVAPRADGAVLGGRPVRPVAARPRVRPLLRVPRGRDRPVPSRARVRQPPDRPAGRSRGRLPPQRGPGRPGAADDRPTAKGVRPDRPFFALPRRSARRTRRTRRRPSTWRSTAGAFDEGWDVVRRALVRAAARARASIPDGHRARAAQPRRRARGTTCPRTSSGSPCRLQEAFAAFLDHTDDQIGRLVDGLRDLGRARQHACCCVLADNGASQEGGPFGVMHEMKFFNGILETPDEAIERHRRHRRPAQPHQLPVGLGAVRQHAVQVVQAEHPRGRRPRAADRALAEPASRPDQRRHERDQFVNVADIAPTIYDLARRHAARAVYRGIEQLPVTGHSFATVARRRRGAGRPTRSSTSRWAGSRALVRGRVEGGAASTRPGADYDTEPWELYHLGDDWSECHDLAGDEPEQARRAGRRCGGPRPSGTACCRSTTG